MSTGNARVAIFVPSSDFDPHATRCTIYAQEQGYEVEGIVIDNWDAILRMMADGTISVVIVSEESHLNPKRTPRIEVVANAASCRHDERTRVIRRT